MRYLSDDIVAKLQGGLTTPFVEDVQLEEMDLDGQVLGGRFAIEAWIGSGGMGSVHKAIDRATGAHAVVKVLRPEVVAEAGKGATLSVMKEAVALGRLNEQKPRTPHVVRFLDTGTHPFVRDGERLELPWIAIEYVDGGKGGTTLGERVENSVRESGSAFDRARAARAVAQLAEGLSAVHHASVVHRDLKPANVLATGEGEGETWKLADFGIARPDGVAATFGGLVVGTPGYAPPELVLLAQPSIGPWTDVFGFAAVIYYLLTATAYFPVRSVRDGIRLVREPTRKSVLEGTSLHPSLRADVDACRAIDAALLASTLAKPNERTQTAAALAEPIVRALRGERSPVSEVARAEYTWRERAPRLDDVSIEQVAWDRDRCFAVTSRGVLVAEGGAWRQAPLAGASQVSGVRFVKKLDDDRWLVGGDASTLAVCSERGGVDLVRGADASVRFDRFDGDLHDLAVIVGDRGASNPMLFALVGRHWLKPLPVREASRITALARLDATRWIVGGVAEGDGPFLAVYAPLEWSVTRVAVGGRRPVLSCASDPERGLGFALTADGFATALRGTVATSEIVWPQEELTAAAIDDVGVAWAASTGRVFFRDERAWSCVCDDRDERSPFVGIDANGGRLRAVTRSGRVLEGAPR